MTTQIENGVNVTIQEISIVARDLRADSKGAITHREAIERARAITLARHEHAANCTVRAIAMALAAVDDANAARFVDSALRFMTIALRQETA